MKNGFKNQFDKEMCLMERELEALADKKGYPICDDKVYSSAIERIVRIEYNDEPSTYRAWLEIAMDLGVVRERIKNYR